MTTSRPGRYALKAGSTDVFTAVFVHTEIKMDIYTYPKSRSIRATWVAEELGLDYQCHFVNVLSAAKHTPGKNKKVPALVDGDMVIFESSAICIYLAQAYGNGQLYPQDLRKQAMVNQWLAYIISELEAPLWTILKHAVVWPEALRKPALIEPAKADFLRAISLIEQEINGKTWLCNDTFSVADIFLFHISRWATTLGLPLSETLTHYVAALETRPALHRARLREEAAANTAG
ncbi:glutathione S-transferase family protein [Morganella psychrotolerans]|uniref:glutathione S-transferase family protein n=1 Tax=Morganella psychrotolerans TaxID=368603 RepID=UPI0039AEA118